VADTQELEPRFSEVVRKIDGSTDIGQEGTEGSQDEGAPVFLHIYDVSEHTYVQWLNVVFAHRWSPLKFGGFFHVGVEVYGVEWTFGYCPAGTGVALTVPRRHPGHHYRESLAVGRTALSRTAVASLLGGLSNEYPGTSYSLLRKNCCHFAEELLHRLKCGPIPAWVYRLACIGGSTAGAAESVLERAGIQHLSRSSLVPMKPL
jgi:hypothetical protein